MSGGMIDLRNRTLSFTFNGIAFLGILGGCFCVFLGYKLFGQPVASGTGEMTAKIARGMADIGIKGSWPGIFFMGFGALVIMVAMLSAGAGALTKPLKAAPQRRSSSAPD